MYLIERLLGVMLYAVTLLCVMYYICHTKKIGKTLIYYKRGSDKMNMKRYEFDAVIKKVPNIDGAYVDFPYDVKKEFNKGRVKVIATFDGIEYLGSLVKMKTPNHIIGLRKDIRKIINKQPGDIVHVTIQERE